MASFSCGNAGQPLLCLFAALPIYFKDGWDGMGLGLDWTLTNLAKDEMMKV